MPILDLIASITGEKPPTPTNPPPRPSTALPKRKAEDEIRTGGTKVARVDSASEKQSKSNGNSPRSSPRPADRSLGGSGDKKAPKVPSTADKKSLNGKPSAAGSKPTNAGATSSTASKPQPSRPVVSRPNPTESGPPKKRSYAEIMARAKANSEQREALVKIQHKTVERSMSMKERKELRAAEAKKARMAAGKSAAGRPGTASTPVRDTAKASGMRNGPSSASASASASTSTSTNGKKTAAPVEEKKVKKAALATTGYTGTARPRPGSTTAARPGAPNRPSTETHARDRPRYGLSTSRRSYEEEDDDLDDFIVDDDEEEGAAGYGFAREYRYESYDDDSDMEAGLSDIEDEEKRAETQALREDMEQEALERRLKREKEERKRKFLEAAKAKAGR
ncbi:hypothetical protein VTH06DRAFT_2685 [Thermothelomyces fergusii]